MHGFLEADMGEKPALQPTAAIGPALRAIARSILAHARAAMTDPERSDQDAVHNFRRSMKQWRALMRLLEPFIPDAVRLRQEARDHARSLARARDGQSALNAFDDLGKTLVLSERTTATIRGRIEAIRGTEEQAVLTPRIARCDRDLARIGGGRDRAVATRSFRLPLDRRAAYRRLSRSAAAHSRATGPRRARKNCISCASASSIIAIRWSWSSRCGRAMAACGPRKPSGCATGSGAARTWRFSSASPGRISRWRIGARGWRRHAPSAPTSSRSAPRASRCGCSPKGPRRSGTGWKRCGTTGVSYLAVDGPDFRRLPVAQPKK